jgi:hypothetical protein
MAEWEELSNPVPGGPPLEGFRVELSARERYDSRSSVRAPHAWACPEPSWNQASPQIRATI